MFKRLRIATRPSRTAPVAPDLSLNQLIGNAELPVSLKAINSLPLNPKLRLYRTLIPIQVLTEMDIDPRSWKNPAGEIQVRLEAEPNSHSVQLSAWVGEDESDPYFYLDLADNTFGGIDLNFVVINDPRQPKYAVDVDEQGRPTGYGRLRRHLAAEAEAMRAGLAPGQIRPGLRASGQIFGHIETFLNVMSHQSIALEPLSYTSAWVFERRGFAYIRGHKLMDAIHSEFMPGRRLHAALDGSTPFRQPEQWNTVRGRAWAIHDGILDQADLSWDAVKMIKQIGQDASVNTFPEGAY
jgi:hypothetical protein